MTASLTAIHFEQKPIIIRDPHGRDTPAGAGGEKRGAGWINWLLEESPTRSPTLIGSLRFRTSASPQKTVGRWVSERNYTFSFPLTLRGTGKGASAIPAIRFS